jgi:uncharacterized integral membrane protein
MPYQYKRRRPSIIRNFWVYRRLVGTAILLGLMLWFIWANGDSVTVRFPFGLGKLSSTTGIVILMSALVGSLLTMLATTVVFALRRLRSAPAPHEPHNPSDLAGDRPPPDYAAKTSEGFPNAHWSN